MASKILGFALGGIPGLLFSKKKKKEPAPEPVKPTMPLADDEAIKAEKRRELIRRSRAGGRDSTMLTTDSDTLGG